MYIMLTKKFSILEAMITDANSGFNKGILGKRIG